MPYDFAVNTRFSREVHHVGRERQPIVVVDDFLRDPEAVVRYAGSDARFGPPPKTYPGIIAPLPDAYIDALVGALGQLLGDAFGLKLDTAFLVDSFIGIATFTPEELHYGQRLPHVDEYNPGQLALLHYLCAESQGGTAMYRHRTTGYETLSAEKHYEMNSLITQEIAQNPLPARYVGADNPLFEQTASFDAKFNRLIIYRGQMLHSMSVAPSTRLSPDPRVGRLTANTFLHFDPA
jgi:hypothetical protein